MSRLFVSYTHDDLPFVERLAAALVDRGHEVWWDRELAAGKNFREQIREQLDAADLVIVVWSARSRLSRWVPDEADLALTFDKPLVPVAIDSARPALGFGSIHSIDLSRWTGGAGDPALAALVDQIRRRLEEGPTSPAMRPPIRVAANAIALSVAAALAAALAQAVFRVVQNSSEGATSSLGPLARFAGEHALLAFGLALPVAFFAGVRARSLGLSRFRAVLDPFLGTLGVGLVGGLAVGALALASGAGADLSPSARAAELAANVLFGGLVVAALLAGVRLLIGLLRTR